jgi:hypothetical protein
MSKREPGLPKRPTHPSLIREVSSQSIEDADRDDKMPAQPGERGSLHVTVVAASVDSTSIVPRCDRTI